MNKNIYIYPGNGEIITDKEYSIWIKFMGKKMVDISSLKMKINRKLVPALLSENGIIYNQKYALEYGINDVEVNWKFNNGKEEVYRWRFILLEYKIGISENEINCIDLSLIKDENLKVKDIMDIEGIPIFTRNQLDRKVTIGKLGRKTGEVDLIELLEIKKDRIKNVDESRGYVFGEIIENSKKYSIYEMMLGKRESKGRSKNQGDSNIKMYYFKSIKIMESFLSENDVEGFLVTKDKYSLNNFLKEYTKVLDSGHRVGIWGVNSKEKGNIRVKIYGKNYSSGFHEGLRNKRSIISNIDNYKMIFSINGRIIGDTVIPQFKDILELSCRIDGNEKIQEVKVLGNGGNQIYHKKFNGEKSVLIKEDINIVCKRYAICIIKCSKDRLIITSPIWIGKK